MKTMVTGVCAAALFLAACGDSDPAAPEDSIVTVEVDPTSANLLVGDTLWLAAQARSAIGDVVPGVPFQWSVDVEERLAVLGQAAVGRVIGLRAGAAMVTVSAGERSAEAVLAISNPVPVLTALEPAEATAGDEGFLLTVSGEGFTPDSHVEWNGEARPTTFVGATELQAQIEASDIGAAGTAGVRVVTALPGGGTSEALEFEVTPPAPGPVASVELDTDSIDLPEGDTRQLVATVRDDQGQVIEELGHQWSSGEPGVALVDGLGTVTAIRSGRAVITVKVHGKEASAVVRVAADYGFDLMYSAWDPTASARTPHVLDIGDAAAVPQPITFGGVTAGVLAPSPEGGRVAFAGETTLQGPGIYVAGRDGSGLVLVAAHPGESCGQIAWRPDGQRIAYVCGLTGADQHVVTARTDGVGDPGVLTADEPGRDSWPSWSPLQGGTYRIAYARMVNGEPRIFTMREDGTDHVQITSGMDSQPAWSPDGATIAFQRTGAAIFGDIWLVDAAGGNERSLMPFNPLAGPQWRPQWSPDGRLIAFTSQHETYGSGTGVDQIYTVWADGSKVARRTDDPTEKSEPAWLKRPAQGGTPSVGR